MSEQHSLSRRNFLKLLGAGTAAATLAACAPPSTSPSESAGADTAGAPAAEAVVLRYMDRAGALGDFMRHASRVYEEQNPGITVENESSNWTDLTTKVPTYVAADTMADLAFQHNAFMLPELAKKGAWMNVEDLAASDGHDFGIYYPFAVEALKLGPEDQMVAMPMGIHFGENDVMWNVEMLQELGVEEPRSDMSFDEFNELIIQIQEKLPEGKFAAYFSNGYWGMEAHSRSFNGHILDNERTHCDLTMPETMAAHEWLIDLVNNKKAVPTVDDVLDTHNAMFYSEVLAIDSNTAPNVWVGFNEATEGRFTLGHCVWPHGDGGTVGITPSVDSTVIYGKTNYPDESWGLAKLLSSAEISRWAALSDSHMTPGAVLEAWHDPEVWDVNPPYQHLAEFWDTLTPEDYGAVPVPANTRKGEYWDTYTNEWVAMREGDAPFNETTAGELEVKLQAIIDKPLP